MKLTTVYKIFRLVRDGSGFPTSQFVLIPAVEGGNTFDSEEEALYWMEQLPLNQRYTEFVVLPIYSMI